MVIDGSALAAVLLREPDAAIFADLMLQAPRPLIGAPSYVETMMVLLARLGLRARPDLDEFIYAIGAEVAPFSVAHAERAVDAFLRFGKGRHRAGLNFGDCCSYGLASALGLPLLFKGDDFAATDIARAGL